VSTERLVPPCYSSETKHTISPVPCAQGFVIFKTLFLHGSNHTPQF